MKNILNSSLAIFFSDIDLADAEKIKNLYSLELNEAQEIWNSRFQYDVSDFHKLPKSSWLYSTNWKNIGRWLEPYNEPSRFHEVLDLIRVNSGWTGETRLMLIQSKKCMIELSFFHLCEYWEELFCICDDGPILMSKSPESSQVFQFYPLGNLVTANVQF